MSKPMRWPSLSVLLIVALAGTAVGFTTWGAARAGSESPPVQGDADCTGLVDSIDGLFILRYAAQLEPYADCIPTSADADCNEAIESLDALAVLRFVAGLPPFTVPAECPPIGADLATPVPTVPLTDTPTPTPGANSPTPTTTPSPTPTATPTPTPTAAPPTPSATPTPEPTLTFEYALAETDIGVDAANMLDLAFVPGSDDEGVVATQTGRLWLVSLAGNFEPTLFGDITDRVTRVSDEGLLGITFAPDDPATIYLNYTTGGEAQYWGESSPGCGAAKWAPLPHADPKRSRISRFTVSGDQLDTNSEEVILEVEQPHCHHNVSDLVFGPDGYLYVGVGDGGGVDGMYDPGPDTDDLLGTILRIDVSGEGPGYAVPADNPFVDGDGPNADEIWAYGLRHPWRFNFDSASGTLWAGDVGQARWEEVDRILRGRNYGWNIREGNQCLLVPSGCGAPAGYVPPNTVYPHGDNVAIVGGFVYHGTEMLELEGWYIFGDFLRPRIFAMPPGHSGDPLVLFEGSKPFCICLTSLAQTPTGEILAITAPRGDDPGEILKLTHQ